MDTQNDRPSVAAPARDPRTLTPDAPSLHVAADVSPDDLKFMRAALREAVKAGEKSEVPVGAVVVLDGKIVARAHNVRTTACDPTAHAEIMALRKAGKKLGHWNLEGCELYVTKEPCVMCAGAIVLSRIKRVRYGAFDRRFGCGGTVRSLTDDPEFNHRAPAEGGIMECECAKLLTDFFKARRKKPAPPAPDDKP